MRRALLILLALAAPLFLLHACCLASDWMLHRGSQTRTGSSPESLPASMTLAWQYKTGGPVVSSPAVMGGTVYFGSYDGYVYAVDAKTGATKWKYATGDRVYSSPCVDGDSVFIATRSGHLLCLNAATGAVQWDYRNNGHNLSSPVVSNGIVVCGAGYPDKSLFAVRQSDGQLLWRTPVDQFVHSSPAVSGTQVFYGCNDGRYRASDLFTGTVNWRFNTMGGVFMSTPCIHGTVLYAAPGDYDRNVYAISTETGSQIWAFHVPQQNYWDTNSYVSSPCYANGKVYIVAGYPQQILYSLNATTGAKNWQIGLGRASSEGYAASPTVSNDTIYVGGADGTFWAFQDGPGSVFTRWSCKLGGPILSSAAAANGWIYVGSMDGNLYAFAPASEVVTFVSPPGFIQKGWNLVSVPGDPINHDPLAVFSAIDVPGGSFQFWRNDLEEGGYTSYGFDWNGPVTVGTPYWFVHNSDLPVQISFQGRLVSGDATITIPAHTGPPYWIMIATPFNHRTYCTDIKFSVPSSPTPVGWTTAVSNGWIEASAQGFSSTLGSFFTAGPPDYVVERTSLEPWYGYWMLVKIGEPLSIIIPAQPVAK